MSQAVVRTVIDPQTGETVDLMAFPNHGKIRFQRLRSFEERMTSPRAYENLAAFGETATQAFGRKKTGPLPPAAEVVEKERPNIELEGEADNTSTRKQRHYQNLLGAAAPEMQREALMRRALEMGLTPHLGDHLAGPDQMDVDRLRLLRDKISTSRTPVVHGGL